MKITKKKLDNIIKEEIQNLLNEKPGKLPSNLIFPALKNLKKAIELKNTIHHKDNIEAAIKQVDKILRKMTLRTPARKILSQIMDFPSGKLSPQAKVGDSSQVEAVIDAVEMDALNLN